MSKSPIKRHASIQPVSRDHHHGLLLGWKIRTGLLNKVAPERIYKYSLWFYTQFLVSHFIEEETYLFPILGEDHVEVRQAMVDHEKIHSFFRNEEVTEADLLEFEKLLTDHIRFEERTLFKSIQKKATESELNTLSKHLVDHPFVENTEDEFWLADDNNL